MQCKSLELLEILLEETCSDQNACQRIGRAIAKDLKREIVEETMYKLYEVNNQSSFIYLVFN